MLNEKWKMTRSLPLAVLTLRFTKIIDTLSPRK